MLFTLNTFMTKKTHGRILRNETGCVRKSLFSYEWPRNQFGSGFPGTLTHKHIKIHKFLHLKFLKKGLFPLTVWVTYGAMRDRFLYGFAVKTGREGSFPVSPATRELCVGSLTTNMYPRNGTVRSCSILEKTVFSAQFVVFCFNARGQWMNSPVSFPCSG